MQTEVDPLLKNVPPHSIEAERAVLGALLIDPGSIDDVATMVTPEHFYRPAHALIYSTILELWRYDKPVDVVLLNEELTRRNVLEQVGGTAALAELTEAVPTAANAPYYAKIIRDHAARRDLIRVTAEVQKDAFDVSSPTEELLDRTEKRLFEVTQQRIRSEAVPVATVVEEAYRRLKQLKDGQGVSGLPSGFEDLDELTQGFQPGEMTILAARPSMGKCVAWDTEVLLADGSLVTIEEVYRRRDAELLTLGPDLKLRLTRPSVYVDDGVKPVFRVTTRLGRTIETTASHPFLTVEGWKPLAELAVGVHVAVPRRVPVRGVERIDEARAAELARAYQASGVVPPDVLRLDRESLVAFLREVFATASHEAHGGPTIVLACRTPEGARRLQHLLLRVDVVAAVRGEALEVDRGRVRAALLNASREERDAPQRATRAERAASPSRPGALTSAPARVLRPVLARLLLDAGADVLFDEIVSIEAVGEKQVYDLTIPETHNFVANDVCVHNTSFCLNILRNITVYQGRPAVFFSLEMPRLQVTSNILCSLARIDGHRLRGGYLTREEERQFLDAAEILAPAPLFIDDTPGLSTMELRAKVRRLKAQHDIAFVVIDYLQLMSGSDRAAQESRQQEVSEISRMIKSLARELHIPIMALAQLSRKVEDRKDHKPMMSDLRESGSIEQDADLILLLFRPEYYDPGNEELKNKAEVIVAKNRNGPVGEVRMAFFNSHMRFESLTK